SSGAAIAAVWLIGAGDFGGRLFNGSAMADFAGLFLAAPVAAFLAARWRSVPLAHGAALGVIGAGLWLAVKGHDSSPRLRAIAVALGVLAAAGRWWRERGEAVGGVFYGWLVWGALGFFAPAGFGLHETLTLAHRIAWLAIGGGLIALGRRDRMGSVTAAGVL